VRWLPFIKSIWDWIYACIWAGIGLLNFTLSTLHVPMSAFVLSVHDDRDMAIMSISAKELILDICISLFDFEFVRANINFNSEDI
jgi:hypothetical protein